MTTKELRIKQAEIVILPIQLLEVHPDNRPLGTNTEKLEQLKILINNDGFDSSHPLLVRKAGEGYQIIEGEHRYRASKELGYLELPCVVREMDDSEALIHLVLGNIQSENKPIEVGLNALKVVQKDSKKGYSAAAYAQRLGIGESTIRRYLNAAEVYQYLKEENPARKILDEVYKLEEIHRSSKEDWTWFHQLVLDEDLSKNQVIEISQAIRDIKTDSIIVQELFNLQDIRKDIARQILKNENGSAEEYVNLLESVKTSYDNLEEHITLYEYNVLQDTIDEEEINLKEWFTSSLKELKNLDKQTVLETYKDALQMKRSSTKEEAERTAEHYRDKKNSQERLEQERIAKEMRQVKLGEWWQLGDHFLYCGDASSPVFQSKLPSKIAFAFANPPYKADLNNTEEPFEWTLDWLSERAENVVVTPALHEIQAFLKTTLMPYRWSMACWLTSKDINTWIYTALFSKDKNAQRKAKDIWKIEMKSSHKSVPLVEHKGSKPYDFMEYLITAFSKEKEIIVDAIAGSGVSIMAAEDTRRICYAAEKNPIYCKEIIDLWESANQSGEKATKIA